MKHIFYFIGLIYILWEILSLSSPRFLSNKRKEIKKILDNKSDLSLMQSIYLIFFVILYWIWLLVGLITFQWWLFCLILVLGFMPKKHYVLVFFDALITSILLLFGILNTYHFKITFSQVIEFLLG